MRLIDADALMNASYTLQGGTEEYHFGFDDGYRYFQREVVGDAPTIDAVPVVRCKDCRWFAVEKGELAETYKVTGCYRLRELGKIDPLLASGNGFCSWGLPMEEEHNG